MLTVLGGVGSVYETAPLAGIHQRIAGLSPIGVDERTSHPELVRALRILTDHLRSAVFILGDPAGVLPSNQGRGSVLRRLIRRAVRACQTLGIQPQRWAQTAELVIDRYGSPYPELPEHADRIANALIGEGERFEATLRRATAKLGREIARLRAQGGDRIPAEVAFHLYDTDGLPIDVTGEIAREAGFGVDLDGFERLFDQHRQRSRPEPPHAGSLLQWVGSLSTLGGWTRKPLGPWPPGSRAPWWWLASCGSLVVYQPTTGRSRSASATIAVSSDSLPS